MSVESLPSVTTSVGERLQTVLVLALDLGLCVKQVHWNARGDGFRALHLQLDELADALRDQADDLAERAATVGVPPDGRAVTLAGRSPLGPLAAGPLSVAQGTDELIGRLEQAAAAGRSQLTALGDEDPVSQDVVIGFLALVEKQMWLLRAGT